MKWYLSALFALVSSLTVSEAQAYWRTCYHGNPGTYGWSSDLNPTFVHHTELTYFEADFVVIEYGGYAEVAAGACTRYQAFPLLPSNGHEIFGIVVGTQLGLGLGPGCFGLNYRFQAVRGFTGTFTYIDPSDPFGVIYTYTGPWPFGEGLPCPSGYVYGVLSI